MFSDKLIEYILSAYNNIVTCDAAFTWIHKDASVGNRFSSRLGAFLLSATALGFRCATDFLNGSVPEAFAHWWHRKPGPGLADMVYFVCRLMVNPRIIQ